MGSVENGYGNPRPVTSQEPLSSLVAPSTSPCWRRLRAVTALGDIGPQPHQRLGEFPYDGDAGSDMIRSDDFVVMSDLVADFRDLVPIDYAFQIVAILPGNVMATFGDSSQQPFNGQPWHLVAVQPTRIVRDDLVHLGDVAQDSVDVLDHRLHVLVPVPFASVCHRRIPHVAEDGDRILPCRLENVGLHSPCLRQPHGATETAFQFGLNPVAYSECRIRRHVDGDIHIAFRDGIAAGHGSEQPQGVNANSPEYRFSGFQVGANLSAIHDSSTIVESDEDYGPARQRTPKLSTHRSAAPNN